MNTNGNLVIRLFVIAACVAVIGLFSFLALRNPWLWFDESGQFWISKGLHHYSDVYAASGSFWDMIESNRHYNLDPGGFSVLLYFWLLINDHSTFFLRLLPYLFFIGFAVFSFIYIYRTRRNVIEAVFYTTLLFVWENTANEMGEVRGYSMEMCGVLSTLYFLPFLRDGQRTNLKLFLLGTWVAVFCTSRYDFILFAFGVSLWMLWQLYRGRKSIGGFFLESVCYSVPVVAMALLIVGGMLIHQDPAGSAVTYLYLGSNPRTWISPMFLFAVLNTLLILRDYRQGRAISEAHQLFLVVFGIYALLSLLNMYPLDPRASMGFMVLVTFTLGERLLQQVDAPAYVKGLLVSVVLLLGQETGWSRLGSMNMDTDTFVEYLQVRDSRQYDKMFVDYWMTPSFRYVYEYGNLKGRAEKDGYPGRFCLQIDDSNPSKVVMPAEVDCNYYLITGHTKFTKHYDMSPFCLYDDEARFVYVKNRE